MKIIQTPNGIQVVDDIEPFKPTNMDLTYERSEIPQELIEECDRLSNETGITHFIFDNDMTSKIISHQNKDDQRNSKVDVLLSKSCYHIGNETDFEYLPSRFAYYDSETKLTDRYKRYNYVIDFIKNLTFKGGFSNFGPEYEQSFTLNLNEDDDWYNFIIRVSPNLFISVISNNKNELDPKKVYSGYFNKSKIYNSIQNRCPKSFREIIRERKLEDILK